MQTTADTKERLRRLNDYFSSVVGEHEQSLLSACRACDRQRASEILPTLLAFNGLRADARQVEESCGSAPLIPTYHIGSLLLEEGFREVSGQPEEDAVFATGIKVEANRYTVEKLLRFKLARRSAAYVEADQVSMTKVLVHLDRYGHKLLLTLHIHPGAGAEATNPSAIDMDMHRRLEQGRYPAIGAVYSRDGYIRFYSYRREFRVQIYGKGVTHEHDNVYRLTDINTRTKSRIQTRRVRLRVPNRQAGKAARI